MKFLSWMLSLFMSDKKGGYDALSDAALTKEYNETLSYLGEIDFDVSSYGVVLVEMDEICNELNRRGKLDARGSLIE
jgi:hypothetical protein